MLVIKKSLTTEKFDINKIRTSLVNSSDEIELPLNEGDIQVLLCQINRKLSELRKDNDATSAYEIRGVVYDVLLENGFKNVAKSYMRFI